MTLEKSELRLGSGSPRADEIAVLDAVVIETGEAGWGQQHREAGCLLVLADMRHGLPRSPIHLA